MRPLRAAVLPSLFIAAALGSAGCAALGYPVGSVYAGTHVPHGMMRLEGSGSPKGGTAKGEAFRQRAAARQRRRRARR